MKKLGIFLLLAAAGAAGGYYWLQNQGPPVLSEGALGFVSMSNATMRDVVSATGLVKPSETVVVTTEVPGTILRFFGKVNDLVLEGAVLAQLDDRKFRLKVEEARIGVKMAESAMLQAKALLTQAKSAQDAASINYSTQVELAEKGGLRADREKAKAELSAAVAGVEAADAGVASIGAKIDAAKTALADAELALQMTMIKVPMVTASPAPPRQFLILERKANEGQTVGPQIGPLFTLAGNLHTVEVHAQVAEGDINRVRKGLTALFTVSTFQDKDVEFRGVVKEIRPMADMVKGAVYYDTVIEVINQRDEISGEWRLRPGMTVSVDIVRREHANVWRVPTQAMNFVLEDAYISDEAKAKIERVRARPNATDWHLLWTWDANQKRPEPMYVRIGGMKNNEPGLKDGEGNEVLEWMDGREPASPVAAPRLIINAPPAKARGFFDQPSGLKVS